MVRSVVSVKSTAVPTDAGKYSGPILARQVCIQACTEFRLFPASCRGREIGFVSRIAHSKSGADGELCSAKKINMLIFRDVKFSRGYLLPVDNHEWESTQNGGLATTR